MRFAHKEARQGNAGIELLAMRALPDKTYWTACFLLALLLTFSSPVVGSVAAAVNLCASNAEPDSAQQAAPNSQQSEELPRPYDVLKKGLDSNNYLAPLLELKAHETQYLASESMRGAFLEFIIQLSADVGDYAEAYSYEDKLLSSFPGVARMRALYAKELTTSPVDNYRPRNAVEAIASIAGKRQVVMINEEHRTPVHRALTLQLLPALYAKGFRYFAAETLYATDTELSKRGYPTQKTGFYTADPVYADVIRTALKLGYKVVPYEWEGDCTPKADNPASCEDERERGQAQNLVDRILKQDPQAKIFVHVGRSHNTKFKDGEKFAFMGWYFREISKIDPFVIDQVRMSERRNPADEHPLYRYLTRQGLMTEPTVFQSPKGDLWTDDEIIADVRVFQPKARYLNGRPTWLQMGGLRRAHALDLKKLGLTAKDGLFKGQKPLLVQAFVGGEGADAIPIDQFVLYPSKQIPVLMLPKETFQIKAVDESGTIIGHYKLTTR